MGQLTGAVSPPVHEIVVEPQVKVRMRDGVRLLVRPLLRVWETPAPTSHSSRSLTDALHDADPWIRACSVEAVRRGVGEYVGEMAILTQEPRIATLIGVGSVRRPYARPEGL